jgi:hypothetical protein
MVWTCIDLVVCFFVTMAGAVLKVGRVVKEPALYIELLGRGTLP